MSAEDISSFVELDTKKKLIGSKMALMRAEFKILGDMLRGINREQDAWMVSFAARHELLDDVDAMSFDIVRGVATVNDDGSR